MATILDWFEMLCTAGYKSDSRHGILERITGLLARSRPGDYLSLEVLLNGYAPVPGSAAWAPNFGVYLALRDPNAVERFWREHLIFEGPPETAKLILAAFAEVMRERNTRVVVIYWREGFILLRHWGSLEDRACQDRDHAILPDVVSLRRYQPGEVRSSRRCHCGAMQEPDSAHPEPLPRCLFLDEFIASIA